MPPTPSPLLDFERALWRQGHTHVAGLDEAGRGCLAGPVVAAAVILPCETLIPGVTDSKKLTARRREVVLGSIEEQAVAMSTGQCSPEVIDQINILWAAMEAMRRAASDLAVSPSFLLIDGNRCFPESPWPYRTVVKGDLRCQAIAAASIVAKVTRDRIMQALHEEYPVYGWNRNMGYPTLDHYAALEKHGPSPYHRRSFRLQRS